MSPDRRTVMANYMIVPRVDLDLSGIESPEDQWAACKWVSRHMVRDRLPSSVPAGLQASWTDQRAFRQAFALMVVGIKMTKDHENHALYAAIKLADVMQVAQPQVVTCMSKIDFRRKEGLP